jgi:hypothetical protein
MHGPARRDARPSPKRRAAQPEETRGPARRDARPSPKRRAAQPVYPGRPSAYKAQPAVSPRPGPSSSIPTPARIGGEEHTCSAAAAAASAMARALCAGARSLPTRRRHPASMPAQACYAGKRAAQSTPAPPSPLPRRLQLTRPPARAHRSAVVARVSASPPPPGPPPGPPPREATSRRLPAPLSRPSPLNLAAPPPAGDRVPAAAASSGDRMGRPGVPREPAAAVEWREDLAGVDVLLTRPLPAAAAGENGGVRPDRRAAAKLEGEDGAGDAGPLALDAGEAAPSAGGGGNTSAASCEAADGDSVDGRPRP